MTEPNESPETGERQRPLGSGRRFFYVLMVGAWLLAACESGDNIQPSDLRSYDDPNGQAGPVDPGYGPRATPAPLPPQGSGRGPVLPPPAGAPSAVPGQYGPQPGYGPGGGAVPAGAEPIYPGPQGGNGAYGPPPQGYGPDQGFQQPPLGQNPGYFPPPEGYVDPGVVIPGQVPPTFYPSPFGYGKGCAGGFCAPFYAPPAACVPQCGPVYYPKRCCKPHW
jgi:hypothetical protein